MDESTANFLTTSAGEAAVQDAVQMLRDKTSILTGMSRLRRTLTADSSRAVWIAAETRIRGAKKLGGDADLLLLDRDGYEMASGRETAEYHADLFANSGCRHVVDLCAGVGLDAIAIARRGIHVTAYELDPGRARLLKENVRRLAVESLVDVVQGDVTIASLPGSEAAFFDPARRSSEHRWSKGVADTSPPMSFVRTLIDRGFAHIVAKLSPAVDRSVGQEYGADLQFVSSAGECKEALLLTGHFAIGGSVSAVILPSMHRLCPGKTDEIRQERGAYLCEPNPAVIRAGLTGHLAQTLQGWQCDPNIDYFFTNSPISSPFAVCYNVKREIPYSKRAIQQALAGAGHVILKQRGFPQTIDEVRSQLKVSGSGEETVILAAFNGDRYAFIVERLSPPGEAQS